MYNKIMIPLRIIAISLAALIAIYGVCFAFGHPFDLHLDMHHIQQETEKKNQEDRKTEARQKEWVREIESIWRDSDDSCGTIDSRDDNRGER